VSETNIYLVPVDEPSPRRRMVKPKIVRYLTENGIIDGFYDEALGWYAAGPRSCELFGTTGDSDPAFEYAIIYDRSEAHFIPDSQTAGFGARCTSCASNLDDALYRLLEEQGDDADAKDMAGASARCDACGTLHPLVGLKAQIDTAVTRFYVTFCVVDHLTIAPAVSHRLSEIIGATIKVVPERL